jgi:hypothetical protein
MRFWSILGVFEGPKLWRGGSYGRLEIDQNFDHFLESIFARFGVVLGRQVGVILAPRPPQEAPRGSQERPRGLQEAATRVPGGPKRSPRDPRSRSRGLKTLQDRPKRLEKNTIPKTIVHINVAAIAEIDKDKTRQTPGAIKKGRAGGGVPPWGRQSAARNEVAEQGVLDRQQNIESKFQTSNLKAIICLRYLQI